MIAEHSYKELINIRDELKDFFKNKQFESIEEVSDILESFDEYSLNEDEEIYNELEEKENLSATEFHYKELIEEVSEIFSNFRDLVINLENEEISLESFNQKIKELV